MLALFLKCGPVEEGEIPFCLSVSHCVIACNEAGCTFVHFLKFEDVALGVGIPDACSIVECRVY